jgi:hypothetical protein
MLQGSLLTNYIRDIVDGQEAKRELIRIAKRNPEQVLASFKQLRTRDQKDFHWIRQVAAASLEKQVSRGC